MANKHSLGFSSTDFRKKFRAGMTVRTYRDNEVIFSQGDTADAVFYIQRGTVKLTVAATRRKKAIVAVLLRGSFFWRRLSRRAISADLHGEINWALQYHPPAEREHGSHPQARPAVCNAVCWISAFPRHSSRGRLGRSILQFQRKATGTGLVAVWANNQGIKAGAPPEGEPSNPRGDGWYYPREGK
jgi:hypothetical protein